MPNENQENQDPNTDDRTGGKRRADAFHYPPRKRAYVQVIISVIS